MSATVRAGVGGRMVALTDKASGTQLLYDNPKWLKLHRQLDLGEHFLAFGGGMFDVVHPADGRTSYPGLVQCAAYSAEPMDSKAGRGIRVSCRKGNLQIVREMVLAADGPWMTVRVTYTNVGKAAIATAPHLRIELARGKAAPMFVTREASGAFRCGTAAALPGGRGFVFARGAGAAVALVVLYDPTASAWHYTWPMTDFDLVSLQAKPVDLPPGQAVRRSFILAAVRSDAEVKALAAAARAVFGKTIDDALDDVMTVWRRADDIARCCEPAPLSRRRFRRFVMDERLMLATTWPGEQHKGRHPYTSGSEPVKIALAGKAFGQAAPKVQATLHVKGPRLELKRTAEIDPAKGGQIALEAGTITPGVHPCTLTLACGGREVVMKERLRHVDLDHRGFAARLAELERRLADLRKRTDKPKHYRLAMPWIARCREVILSAATGGDMNWRPTIGYDLHGRIFLGIDGFLDFALRICRRLEADEDPRLELAGDVYLAYDMAKQDKPAARRFVTVEAEPIRKRADALLKKAEAIIAAGDRKSAKVGNILRAWAIMGRLTAEYGTARPTKGAAGPSAFWTKFLDEKLDAAEAGGESLAKVDGRWVYDNLYVFYQKHLERFRGYRVILPPAYDPKCPWPLIVNLHGSGGDEHSFAAGDSEWAPFGQIPQAARRGYILVGATQGGNYVRGGAAANDDVRRILAEMKGLFNVDTDRVYCTGGSLGADCTGNLAKDLRDVWAAVFPFSQGGQLFSHKTRRLPFISAQAYNYEVVVLTKPARKYRDAGHYDPKIHHLMCYPGVGHCGMSLDVWPFALDFFDRHKRSDQQP